jgi:hypothetical protein
MALEIYRVKLGGCGIDFSGIAEVDGAGIFCIINFGRPSKSNPAAAAPVLRGRFLP